MSVADELHDVVATLVADSVPDDGNRPSPGLWPTEFLPARRDEARARLARQLEHEIANS